MNNVIDFFNNIGKTVYDTANSLVQPIWNPQTTTDSQKTDSSNDDLSNQPTTVEELPNLPVPGVNGSGLSEEFQLLKIEAMHHTENKVRTAYNNLKTVREKNQAMTQLLQHITTYSAEDGSFHIKDDHAHNLLHTARQAGLTVEQNKIAFNKDERDALVRNIELHTRNLETDIKLKVNEVQEGIQIRNTFFQELKTMWDKLTAAISKILTNVGGR